jgi:hypothetical protein
LEIVKIQHHFLVWLLFLEKRSDKVKAILVLEMPSKCIECPCCNIGAFYDVCRALNATTPCADNGKPDWCPLKTMPQKIGTEEALKMPRNGCLADVINSYNACIDEILGGSEE